MRPIELLIVIAGLSYLLWLSFGPGLPNSVLSWLPFAAALLVLIHLKLESYRWQMLPAYVLVGLLLVSYGYCSSHHFRIRLTYMAVGWLAAFVLMAVSAVTAGVIYPVFEFAPLTGSYAVGAVSMHLTDPHRIDPYAGHPDRPREVMAQVWYPADNGAGYPRALYRDGRKEGWRDVNLALVRTRSFTGPPISKRQSSYPVLIFTGPINRFQNTFETEELASHGFIVVGIDHPYDSDLVIFPDGRRIKARKANTFLDFTSEEAFRKSTEDVEFDLQVRVADVRFVLDQIARWNAPDSNSRFSGRLDLSKIGAFGHSFGGAVIAEACRKDARLRAGINMDGWMFGESRTQGIPKPFFFMVDCTPRPAAAELHSPNEEARLTAQRIEDGYEEIERSMGLYGGYYLQVPGLEHMNYSDFPLHSQLKSRTGAGTIDARRAHELVNQLSLAFFDKYLLGENDISLKTIAAKYPEAYFKEMPLTPRAESAVLCR